jgi:hypothetical protein
VGDFRHRGVGDEVCRGSGFLQPHGLIVRDRERHAASARPRRDGEPCTLPRGGRKLAKIRTASGARDDLRRGGRRRRAAHVVEPLQQGSELEGEEELSERAGVPLPHANLRRVHVEGKIAHERRQPLVPKHLLAGRLERRHEPAKLLRHLVEALVELLDGAELLHQSRRRLVADSRHAGKVVGRVAFQRDEVAELGRRQAEPLLHRLLVVPGDVGDPLAVEQHAHVGTHELEHVAISRHDHRLEALLDGAPRERGDHVVGLVVGHLEDRDAERVEHLAEQSQLRGELRGRLGPPGLVLRVLGQANRRPAEIERDRDPVGALL